VPRGSSAKEDDSVVSHMKKDDGNKVLELVGTLNAEAIGGLIENEQFGPMGQGEHSCAERFGIVRRSLSGHTVFSLICLPAADDKFRKHQTCSNCGHVVDRPSPRDLVVRARINRRYFYDSLEQ
jgi:hypothetical protein